MALRTPVENELHILSTHGGVSSGVSLGSPTLSGASASRASGVSGAAGGGSVGGLASPSSAGLMTPPPPSSLLSGSGRVLFGGSRASDFASPLSPGAAAGGFPSSSDVSGGGGGGGFAWTPTRVKSPYCVLSAAGVVDDYYTGALSWGRERVALALQADLLLFDPRHQRTTTARAHLGGSGSDSGDGADSHQPRPHPRLQQQYQQQHSYGRPAARAPYPPTATAVTRFNDAACFVGFGDGAAALYSATDGGGELRRLTTFRLPPSLHEELTQTTCVRGGCGGGSGGYGADASYSVRSLFTTPYQQQQQRRQWAELAAALRSPATVTSLSSVTCMATSVHHPWSAAVGSSSRGLLTLDTRAPQPSALYGEGSHSAAPGGASPSGGLAALRRHLMERDRLCGVAFNSSGSLIATGGNGGVVNVWSVARTAAPLLQIPVAPGRAVRALQFNPVRPYELLVGSSAAGIGGVRIYDVSGSGGGGGGGGYGSWDSEYPCAGGALFHDASSMSADWAAEGGMCGLGLGRDGRGAEAGGGGGGAALLWVGTTAAETTQVLYAPDGESFVSAQGARRAQQQQEYSQGVVPSTFDTGAVSPPVPLHRTHPHRHPRRRASSVGEENHHHRHHIGSSGSGSDGGDDSEEEEAQENERLRELRAAHRRSLRTRTHHNGLSELSVADWGSATGAAAAAARAVLGDAPPSVSGAAGGDGGWGGATRAVIPQPPCALLLWGKSGHGRRPPPPPGSSSSSVPAAPLLDWDEGPRGGSDDDDDDEGDGLPGWQRRRGHGPRTAGGGGGGGGRAGTRALSALYALPGHLSRPLHLAAPFTYSRDVGCVASVAAGEDGTLRFWRVFQTPSPARYLAAQSGGRLDTATEEPDASDCFTTPLR